MFMCALYGKSRVAGSASILSNSASPGCVSSSPISGGPEYGKPLAAAFLAQSLRLTLYTHKDPEGGSSASAAHLYPRTSQAVVGQDVVIPSQPAQVVSRPARLLPQLDRDIDGTPPT